MIDLKHEIERELNLIEPPDLWERIQADAVSEGAPAVLDLTSARHRRRRPLWLGLAAVAACVAVVALATLLMSDRSSVDATDPAHPSAPTTGGGRDDDILLPGVWPLIDGPLAGETLRLIASGEDGVATGTLEFEQIRVGMVVDIDCFDMELYTGPNGIIVWGGDVTIAPGDGSAAAGDRLFVIHRKLDPLSESVMIAQGDAGESCREFLESAPSDLLADESSWSTVGDIEPG